MKPDWDKLMEAFAGSATQLVADVDCDGAGESLCGTHGIQGYPTIKWGDPADLQDYEGGRDYESLKSFADENLKPMCSPVNLDLCNDDKKAEINKFMEMKSEDLESMISEKETEMQKLESDFEEFVEGLQNQYQEAMMEKEKGMDAIKKSGLSLMKSVMAFKEKKDAKDEL